MLRDPEMLQLILTPKAAEKVRSLIEKEGRPNLALRIFIGGESCCGLRYGMALDENAHDGDRVIESNGIRLLVDPDSAQYLRGAEIDYVESVMGAGFTVNNPNAESTCGCGQSFKAKH